MLENTNPPKSNNIFHPFKFPHLRTTMSKSKKVLFLHKKQKHNNSSMEEDATMSLILEGCKLAKDLESNLSDLSNQPHLLFNSCDQITKIFDDAKKRLQSAFMIIGHDQPHEQQQQIDPSLQEWLQSNCTQAMDMIQSQLLAARSSNIDANRNTNVSNQNLNIPAVDATVQRTRRRRENMDTSTVRMDAPRIGNTEIPPDDGYTWRKYGQKEIMGSRFPRGYYRCTHQKLYQCPAKKQVQRLDDDPYTFEVTYRGRHICHMSATAPSALPQPPPTQPPEFIIQNMMSQAMTTTTSTTTTSPFPLGRPWLSMDFGRGGGSSSGSGGDMNVEGSGGASTSTGGGRFGKDHQGHEFPVIDMADVMFNSGTCSSNSMDFIFPNMDDKWDNHGDKKDSANDQFDPFTKSPNAKE